MRLLKNRERGQAFLMVLVMLVMGSLLVVPGLTLASTSLKYHRVVEKNILETYAADSGVQYALCELGNNLGAFGPESLPSDMNDRAVTVTVEDLGEQGYKVTSIATSDSGSSTTIEAYVVLRPYAIVSTDADATSTFRHDVIVNGDVYYAGELNIIDRAVVNGEVTQGHPFDIGIDPAEYKAEAVSGGTHDGNLIINSDQDLGPLYITGKLEIRVGVNLTLGGTVYVDDIIKTEDDVTITGTGNLLCESQSGDKPIEFKKRMTIDLENMPLIMAVDSTEEIKIGDGCDITGIIYSPNGRVHFHAKGPSYVYGAIVGNNVRLCEDAVVTYLPDLISWNVYSLQIVTWQVN